MFGIIFALLKSRALLAARCATRTGVCSARKTTKLRIQRGEIIMQNTILDLNISRGSFGRGMLGAMAVSGLGMMDARTAIAKVKPDLSDGDVAVAEIPGCGRTS